MKESTELFIVKLYNEGLTYAEIRKQVPYKNTSIARVATKYGLERRQAEKEQKIAEEEYQKEKKIEKEKEEEFRKKREYNNMIMKRHFKKRAEKLKALEDNWRKEKESH